MARVKGIIVDLDGTIANVSHRVHHLKKEVPDKGAFNDAMGEDGVNQWCLEIVNAMRNQGYKIILVTGRRKKYHDKTVNWLREKGVIYDQLYMRLEGEKLPDAPMKKKIYREYIEKEIDILFILEDRLSVVEMWREIGLVCLQCDVGNF